MNSNSTKTEQPRGESGKSRADIENAEAVWTGVPAEAAELHLFTVRTAHPTRGLAGAHKKPRVSEVQ